MYSLNRKNYTYEEFPRRNITLESTYDVMSPSDKFLLTDKDNVFTSFHWTTVDKMMFYNRQTIQFEYETDYNFAFTTSLKMEENEAAGNMTALGYDFTKIWKNDLLRNSVLRSLLRSYVMRLERNT